MSRHLRFPDEEDEELVEKAKANRKARLAQQQTTTRQFIKSEGLNDVKLDKELVPIQRAVLKLAKSGAQVRFRIRLGMCAYVILLMVL